MDRPEHTTPSQSSICSQQGDTPTVQETTSFLPKIDFGNVVEHLWALFFVSALLNVGAGLCPRSEVVQQKQFSFLFIPSRASWASL